MTATRVVAAGRTYVVDGLGYGDEGSIRAEGGSSAAADDDLRWALTASVLCNDAHIRADEDGRPQLVGDPTEGALVVAARKAGLDPEAVRTAEPRLDEVPFDSAVKFMATLHPRGDEGTLLVVKGAPDVVLHRCAQVRRADGVESVDTATRADLQAANDHLGEQGLRVLAIATRQLGHRATGAVAGGSEDETALSDEVDGLTLEALVGILDPARPEAVAAVAECRDAGIGVKMITGDHASTAGAIAAELGIQGRVVTGAELEATSDEELAATIDDIGVCARVSPEHKVRVVKALQARGQVVAMTGDGVNDAPSLKQAEIGVAMGVTGTEVTKEAGDMILTDDNFATIVKAVERGRAIYDNIVTFVRFQLTTNVAAIMTILTARLAGYPAPFNPIQVLFVNILADGPPAMSLGMDPPKPGIMQRPPRDREERILSGRRLAPIVVTAVIMTLTIMAILVRFSDSSPNVDPESDPAFTMAFTTFVFLQMVNALIVRSGDLSVFHPFSRTNRTLWLAILAVVVSQVLVVTVPFLQEVFGTTSLDPGEWLVCVVGMLPLVAVAEIRAAVARSRTAAPVAA
jgi:Ca2+-transporting ATPase